MYTTPTPAISFPRIETFQTDHEAEGRRMDLDTLFTEEVRVATVGTLSGGPVAVFYTTPDQPPPDALRTILADQGYSERFISDVLG